MDGLEGVGCSSGRAGTFDKVVAIMVNVLKIDSAKIMETSSFSNDLGMDSLAQAEFIMELEKAFDCEIPEDVAEKVLTVGDAVTYLEGLNSV
jgi:acyl carrier protein